jgi:hypothetical protein
MGDNVGGLRSWARCCGAVLVLLSACDGGRSAADSTVPDGGRSVADAPAPDAACLGPSSDAGARSFPCGVGQCPAGTYCFVNNEGPPCLGVPDAGSCAPGCVLQDGRCVPDWHFCFVFPAGCSTCESLLAQWFSPLNCPSSQGGTPMCTVSAAGDVSLSCPL